MAGSQETPPNVHLQGSNKVGECLFICMYTFPTGLLKSKHAGGGGGQCGLPQSSTAPPPPLPPPPSVVSASTPPFMGLPPSPRATPPVGRSFPPSEEAEGSCVPHPLRVSSQHRVQRLPYGLSCVCVCGGGALPTASLPLPRRGQTSPIQTWHRPGLWISTHTCQFRRSSVPGSPRPQGARVCTASLVGEAEHCKARGLGGLGETPAPSIPRPGRPGGAVTSGVPAAWEGSLDSPLVSRAEEPSAVGRRSSRSSSAGAAAAPRSRCSSGSRMAAATPTPAGSRERSVRSAAPSN